MNLPEPPEPILMPVEPEPREPFWSWYDASLFLALLLPSIFAAALASRGLFALVPNKPGAAVMAMTFQFLIYIALFVSLWLVLRLRYDRPFWQSLGWKIPWPKAGATIVWGPALAIFVAVMSVVLRAPQIKSPLEELLKERGAILLVGLFAVTLGPLAEEILFRGFLLPLLVRSFGVAAGVVLCGLPFALLHGPQYSWSWRHLLLLLVASVAFSLTRLRTGSTAAATLVHATYNLTFLLGFLFYRKDSPI